MPRGRGRFNQRAQRRASRAQARARGRGRGRGRRGLGRPAPSPFDSQAQRESARLGNEASDTRVDLGARFQETQQELGFGTGASNTYSARAQLKQRFEANRRGTTNAAGNQLYAGSTINKQSAVRGRFDTGQKQLEDTFARAQAGFGRGIARTNRDEALGRGEIKEGAIGRAAASEPQRLAVGRRRGRGGIAGPRRVRRPQRARALNARARKINARVNRRNRGRGRF